LMLSAGGSTGTGVAHAESHRHERIKLIIGRLLMIRS
jgi:hypothetical protein